jgi:hypothetical protein
MDKHDIALFKRLRTENRHPLLPRPAKEVMHEYRRQTSGTSAKWDAEKASWGLDFRWSDRTKPYGGHVSTLTLNAEDVRLRGFDPAHLTCKVTAAMGESYEPVQEEVRNMGYSVEDAARHDENEGRPSHESVRVDFSSPRDRPNYKWVTVGERDARYHYEGSAWKGMARGVRAQVRHEVLLAAAKAQEAYVSEVFSECIQPYNVSVYVYWRGEEVGYANIAGCVCRGKAAEFADCLSDHDLVGEALADAERWADGAVEEAKKRAAQIVNDIALLPERSIEVVRGQFKTATVTNIRKEA